MKEKRSFREGTVAVAAPVRRALTAYRGVATDQKRFLKTTSQVRPLILVVASSRPFSTSSTTNVVCLNVGIEMRVSLVVDFDPITADMAPSTIWHPYHVLTALRIGTCLGRSLEIEIQLSRLIRLGLRVRDRRLDRAIYEQCYPVNARLQSL